jgi:hypothetical protein
MPPSGGAQVPLPLGPLPEAHVRHAAKIAGHPRAASQKALRPFAALLQAGPPPPEPVEGDHQAEPDLRLLRQAPRQRRAEVVLVDGYRVETVQALDLTQPPRQCLGERQKVIKVALPGGALFPALRQLLACILAHRLQQPVASALAARSGQSIEQDQGLVDEGGEEMEHFVS